MRKLALIVVLMALGFEGCDRQADRRPARPVAPPAPAIQTPPAPVVPKKPVAKPVAMSSKIDEALHEAELVEPSPEELRRLEEVEQINQQNFARAVAKFRDNVVYFEERGFSPDFSSVTNPVFYAVARSYPEKPQVFVLYGGNTGVQRVTRLTPNAPEVEDKDFLRAYRKGLFLVADGRGTAWIHGASAGKRRIPIPERYESVCPLDEDLGDWRRVLEMLGAKTPDVAYRVSLVPKNGRNIISVGEIKNGGKLKYSYLSEPVQELMARRLKANPPKKPSLRRFTPTVVFYDGKGIRKEGAVTKVPRTYTFTGIKVIDFHWNNNTLNDMHRRQEAREKWEALRDEALRQEATAAEVERENRQTMAAYEAKLDAINNRIFSPREIEEELSTYTLVLDRCALKKVLVNTKNQLGLVPVGSATTAQICPQLGDCKYCTKMKRGNKLTRNYCESCIFCRSKQPRIQEEE